jgi:uncharacterized protein (TIGR02145 family)
MTRTVILLTAIVLTLGDNSFAQGVPNEASRDNKATKKDALTAELEEFDRLVQRRDSLKVKLDEYKRQRNVKIPRAEKKENSAFDIDLEKGEPDKKDADKQPTDPKYNVFDPNYKRFDAEEKKTNEKPVDPKYNLFEPGSGQQVAAEAMPVTIGKQTWATENLNTDKFRNGDPIPEAKTAEEWLAAHNAKRPAWCYYKDDPANAKTYGRLYNWYAVADPRGLAPEGWHVPTEAEWESMLFHLGGNIEAAKKLRSAAGWSNNGGGTNETGFNALPGRQRGGEGKFFAGDESGYWWSSTPFATQTTGFGFYMAPRSIVGKNIYSKCGLSVRCVKD